MENVLLTCESRIPFADQDGCHSLAKQRTSYTQSLKLQFCYRHPDPLERWDLSNSETDLTHPDCITEDSSGDAPYWIGKEFGKLYLRQKTVYRDLGVEKRNKVECPNPQQEEVLASSKDRTNNDDIGKARILVELLKFYTRQEDFCNGLRVHAHIVQQGLLDTNVFVGCALLNMYAKYGALAKAQKLFDELPIRNIVSWNALLAGYTQHGYFVNALSCFDCMQVESVSPNAVTFTCILNACGNLKASVKGQYVHAHAVKAGLVESDIVLANSIVDMYAKCGSLAKAREILEELSVRDVYSYSTLLVAYAQLGHAKEAFDCFERMQQEGILPSIVTFVGLVKACGSIRAEDLGQKLHAQFVTEGLLDEDISLGTAVVDMYAKCGSLVEAQDVFDELLVRDVVLWNVLIAGYVEKEHSEEALHYFKQMQAEGISPSTITFACILKVSGSLGILEAGQDIHAQIVKLGLLDNQLVVATGLVDMYANCAMLEEAQEVFNKLPVRNVVSWSALMEGFGQQGNDERVFHLLNELMRDVTKVDTVVVTVVLNTCSHGGLLDMAQMHFEALHEQFNMFPTLEHYTCMVDLLGRAGHVEKAITIIEEMHFPANLTLWHTLLGACRKWECAMLGRFIFELAIQLDQRDAETYACMCNIYTKSSSN